MNKGKQQRQGQAGEQKQFPNKPPPQHTYTIIELQMMMAAFQGLQPDPKYFVGKILRVKKRHLWCFLTCLLRAQRLVLVLMRHIVKKLYEYQCYNILRKQPQAILARNLRRAQDNRNAGQSQV
jgi:hypothetical protein